MANFEPNSKVSHYSRKFKSDFGYSRDISSGDIPAANVQDASTLHNVTSLNDNPATADTIAQRRINVPSANAHLKPHHVGIKPLSVQGSSNSSLYGATPPASDQYNQYSSDFQ